MGRESVEQSSEEICWSKGLKQNLSDPKAFTLNLPYEKGFLPL